MSWGAFLGSLINAGANLYTHSVNQKNSKSNYDYQLRSQYKYAQRYALNGPSWAVQGLRNAGLNPILAVSNGVNTGVNIPQASMSSPELKNTLGSDLASLTEAFVAEENAESNKVNAEANKTSSQSSAIQAEAARLRAKADATLKQAQTAETLQRTLRVNSSKYNSPIVRDVMGLIDDVKNQSKDLIEDVSSYLQHSPSDLPIGTSSNVRHSDEREKQFNKMLDSEWKTRKTIDGQPVYRKRGDVGGIMHMYR